MNRIALLPSHVQTLYEMTMLGESPSAIIDAICDALCITSRPHRREIKFLIGSTEPRRFVEVLVGTLYGVSSNVVLFIPNRNLLPPHFTGLLVVGEDNDPYHVESFAPVEEVVSMYIDLNFSDIYSDHGYDIPEYVEQTLRDNADHRLPCAACVRGQLGGGMLNGVEALYRFFLTKCQLEDATDFLKRYITSP